MKREEIIKRLEEYSPLELSQGVSTQFGNITGLANNGLIQDDFVWDYEEFDTDELYDILLEAEDTDVDNYKTNKRISDY